MSLPIAQHQNAVKTVVVPAAGMGTRFLPATKTIPKELLPVVDTPGIELVAKEAADLGATRLAIITAPNKDEILKHFEEFPELEATLEARGKIDQLNKVRAARELIATVPVVQEKPLGLGHAVGLAEAVLDEDEDVVAVMLPDESEELDEPEELEELEPTDSASASAEPAQSSWESAWKAALLAASSSASVH